MKRKREMDEKMLLKAFKALRETARAITAQEPDRHDSTRGKMSPDVIKYYNSIAEIFNQKFPEMQLRIFKENENTISCNYPQTLEILGQIKLAV